MLRELNVGLQVLRKSSEGVFVPLTIGGGIRSFTDSEGEHYSALEVASEYFRSGADKVSIGSDAVEVALQYRASGQKTGTSAIEQISEHYGRQAVVVSIDPKRVWVRDEDVGNCPHLLVESRYRGPLGERHCWWQCTVKGGRETRDLGAVELAVSCEDLGAGEILLNNIDNDGVGEVRSVENSRWLSRAAWLGRLQNRLCTYPARIITIC
jgi:imidazole glycerol-phosphate synthase